MREKLMTVREVADALGVTDRTVRRHAKKLGLTKNGIPTYLNASAATAIKQSIEKSGRKDLDNVVQLSETTTEIEIVQKTVEIISYWKHKAEELSNHVKELEPKALIADRIANAEGLKTISEIGKINGIGPRNIFPILSNAGIIYRNRGSWVPYQDYIDFGYFAVKEITYKDLDGTDHLKTQTYVTGKGEVWLAKQLFKGPANA